MELTVQCADHHTHIGPERVWCVERKWTELPACKGQFHLLLNKLNEESVNELNLCDLLLLSFSTARCKLDPKMTYYYSERYMEHGTEESLFCSALRKVHIKCEDGTAFYRGCKFVLQVSPPIYTRYSSLSY